MIKIKDLEKIYRTEDVETVALNKLSLEVKEGEFVAVMGPSGCGKSTLLNILGLLDDPDDGSFQFNGIEVARFNERKRADLRKRNIGFVFPSVFPVPVFVLDKKKQEQERFRYFSDRSLPFSKQGVRVR